MSTPADMAACEGRTKDGLPVDLKKQPSTRPPVTRPINRVRTRGHVTNTVEQSVDNSHRKNDALPYVAWSWLLSGAALMGVLLMPVLFWTIMEARTAKAEATAELALREARVAKDMVDLDRARKKALEEIDNGK